MTDRDPGTSRGDGQEPKAPGTVSTSLIGDLSPHAPDSGIDEAKPNASLIPQPPIFNQDLIQALQNNQNNEKLSLADTRLINKFLRENGVEQKSYRKMDAKTKVATASDKVESRINLYITDANAYAKKKVEERGFAPQDDFDSPFGPDDHFTVESQKTAIRNRLLSGAQDASVQPGTLEAIYLREIRITVVEKWLRSNRFPNLYTFWAKSPDDIITESGLNTRIDDEDKERFLGEQDQPIPLRSIDEYANDIRELEASIPTDTVSGDTSTQFITFGKVIEARKHILGASVGGKDELVKVDIKLKDTFKILAGRRLVLPLPDGDVEDLTDEVIRLKNGNGSGQETNNPDTTPAPEPEHAPAPDAPQSTEEPDNLRSNFKERIQKMKEDSQKRAEKFIEAMEQRLRDEIPAEDLQTVLDEARMSAESLYADPLSKILAGLEEKGVHISDEVKNDLQEKEDELGPKIDFAEALRSYVNQLPKKESARFLLETRYGENLENISQEDAKKVLNSLIENTQIVEDLPDKDSDKSKFAIFASNIRERAGAVYTRFTQHKEEEKEVVPDFDAERAAKSRRLKKIVAVGSVLGVGLVLAVCIARSNNGNENSGQQASSQDTPTISAARESVLTAQAKATSKAESSTAQAKQGSATPTIPASEPTAVPTTAPSENPQNPPAPPSQPQGKIQSSEYSHDQATTAVDLSDGVKDGFVDVYINESGTNFDNAQAQTLGASGLNLINIDNLYENGALRWKWTLLASGGDGEKYHWVNIGDQIRIPADKLADAYRWSNVQVPDKIASQVKQVSTQVENKNESAVTDYGNHQEQQAANEQPHQSVVDFSGAEDIISNRNLNGEIDVKNLGANVQVDIASRQDKFINTKNIDADISFANNLVNPLAQATIAKNISNLKYSQTAVFRTKQDDEQMRFVAAILYQRERQKLLKKFRLNLNTTDDDKEEDFDLLANS